MPGKPLKAADEQTALERIPAPADLGDAGRAVWEAIISDLPEANETDENGRARAWELEHREMLWLRLACDQADELALLQDAIEREGVTTTGSTGQMVVNPVVAEARQARAAIDRLIGRIRLPDEGGTGRTSASQRGQDAARARWRNGAA